MGSTSRKTKPRTYEVLVSFSGLNAGERFEQEGDDLAWAQQHVESGYLRDVTEEPTVAEAQGGVAPQASEDRVEEAHGGGQERQG
jgi:hypothetical protein